MTERCHLMVISAHPDDSEFGIAGTVAKLVREGRQVVYAVCTNGDKGSNDPEIDSERLARMRKKEQRAAARLLGVSKVVFLDYEDQNLEDTPEFRKEIVRLLRTYRPEAVATSDPYRRYIWHRDHRIVGQVVLDAVYPYARDRLAYPDLLAAGLMPHKVKEVLLWGSEQPDYFSDITDTFELKMAALHCHRSQVGHIAEWDKMVRSRHEMMGKEKGFALAEAFHRAEVPW